MANIPPPPPYSARHATTVAVRPGDNAHTAPFNALLGRSNYESLAVQFTSLSSQGFNDGVVETLRYGLLSNSINNNRTNLHDVATNQRSRAISREQAKTYWGFENLEQANLRYAEPLSTSGAPGIGDADFINTVIHPDGNYTLPSPYMPGLKVGDERILATTNSATVYDSARAQIPNPDENARADTPFVANPNLADILSPRDTSDYSALRATIRVSKGVGSGGSPVAEPVIPE